MGALATHTLLRNKRVFFPDTEDPPPRRDNTALDTVHSRLTDLYKAQCRLA
ncbi:hypothetical protein [Streptomyces sp. NPDC048419]|uniref:hypothetical protein n=1 Tax=Streptomyces sp. NPDC048419 TaxID=3365547 RepID=UPI00372347FF